VNTGFGSDDAGQQSYGDDSGDHRTSATVINATTVRGLPLNGRSWTGLATLQPVNAIQTQPSFAAGTDRGSRVSDSPAFEVGRGRGLADIGGDLRRDRPSWLHAAPNRTAPRRAGCDSHSVALRGATSHQSLGDARDGPHRVWHRRTAGLAWSYGSRIPGMIGHVVMDIGPFG
jgi:hypothetical protein